MWCRGVHGGSDVSGECWLQSWKWLGTGSAHATLEVGFTVEFDPDEIMVMVGIVGVGGVTGEGIVGEGVVGDGGDSSALWGSIGFLCFSLNCCNRPSNTSTAM